MNRDLLNFSLFDCLENRKEKDQQILEKLNSLKPKPVVAKSKGGLLDKVSMAISVVKQHLYVYKDDYCYIIDEDELSEYIEYVVQQGIVAIDTETTGLDPIQDKIVGLSMYTPGHKAVYIPINHVDYKTFVKLSNQLNIDVIKKYMKKLETNNVGCIFYNAVFDLRVLFNHLDIDLKCIWDGYIAARILNENEPSNRLKDLHKKYCKHGEGDAFSFADIFDDISFDKIPIKYGYIYAANDAKITHDLYLYQKKYLDSNSEDCIKRDLTGLANVYNTIELPLIPIVAKMENTGITVDQEMVSELSKKYNDKLNKAAQDFYKECEKFEELIDQYRKKHLNCKLEKPINPASSTQIAILLYDILHYEVVNPDKPRGTGDDILNVYETPLAESIKKYRSLKTILSTFIDNIPQILNKKTQRIHCKFNQVGTDTGRFSSKDPNLQNIPSHNKDIRKIYIPAKGYKLISCDYSAQEPRVAAHICKDKKLIQAYQEGKDVYCVIASMAFDVPYEECKEHKPDGTFNPDGKERRSQAKAIVLGILYGKGIKAIAEDLKITKTKANDIYNKVLTAFPSLKQYMINQERNCKTKGYVETIWGRKRRLPNAKLPEFEFEFKLKLDEEFLNSLVDPNNYIKQVEERYKDEYINKLSAVYKTKEKMQIIKEAEKYGVFIKDNRHRIAEAIRQSYNSPIQGSAADLTKKAMILVGQDELMKQYGFRLLLTVHDELIGEAPSEYAELAGNRLNQLMIDAAKDLVVPVKCDVEITNRWYENE